MPASWRDAFTCATHHAACRTLCASVSVSMLRRVAASGTAAQPQPRRPPNAQRSTVGRPQPLCSPYCARPAVDAAPQSTHTDSGPPLGSGSTVATKPSPCTPRKGAARRPTHAQRISVTHGAGQTQQRSRPSHTQTTTQTLDCGSWARGTGQWAGLRAESVTGTGTATATAAQLWQRHTGTAAVGGGREAGGGSRRSLRTTEQRTESGSRVRGEQQRSRGTDA